MAPIKTLRTPRDRLFTLYLPRYPVQLHRLFRR
jgi:hypothetical protein